MDPEKELADAFRALKKRDVDTFPAIVVSVDKEEGTCVVSDEELEYTDVQLAAVVDGNGNRFFLFPKVDSHVLVSPIMEDLKRLYIEAYSEIESLDLKIEGVQFQIDKDGFLLKKENETLKKLVADLIGACKAMSFTVATTGNAAAQTGATVALQNIAQFEAVEMRFNQFLKDN
ncbi:tudor domain-containing protein [Flavobacterium caeni]|uniref:Uncharacterized protein n=1 Tax=Flavobacterium caeni TaxID=490189 RepID=A0A1G5K3Y7_9FLAO|nr:hypothetical protein [Flavobacterium caeni]SCY94790.1 hypothetical protein SAMN02927903_03054 [Flavobacterium caeni]